MNTYLKLLICIFASLTLVGCESYSNTVAGLGHGIGAIETQDIQQANAWQKVLPDYLGLPPNQVHVMAGSGVTWVEIRVKKDKTELQAIASKLEELNTKNPLLNPLRLP
jgi:hypothetical protein